MHRPPVPPTPEENRETLRDQQFQIAVVNAIKKYYPDIPKWARFDIAAKMLELVKSREEEADDDLAT